MGKEREEVMERVQLLGNELFRGWFAGNGVFWAHLAFINHTHLVQ